MTDAAGSKRRVSSSPGPASSTAAASSPSWTRRRSALGRSAGPRRVEGRLTSSVPIETALDLEAGRSDDIISLTIRQDGQTLTSGGVVSARAAAGHDTVARRRRRLSPAHVGSVPRLRSAESAGTPGHARLRHGGRVGAPRAARGLARERRSASPRAGSRAAGRGLVVAGRPRHEGRRPHESPRGQSLRARRALRRTR